MIPKRLPPALLTSAYLAPVQYYTKLYAAPFVVEERAETYVKQTYRNRCLIAGPDGPLALTVPVEHDRSVARPTRDIRISDHGNWRHLHWNALVSAYRNSPYFEYYADDFRPLYERKFDFLADFNAALRAVVCELLSISPDIRVNTGKWLDTTGERNEPVADDAEGQLLTAADDFRERIRPKSGYADDPRFRPAAYYQVFAGRTGFLPNLSIADLLFNMGPEARLTLRDSIV